jgi:hypothetical protein
MRPVITAVAAGLAWAVASLAPTAFAQSNGPVNAAPAHRERVLRAWDDTIKVDGRDVQRHVEVAFDYTAAVARQRVFDTKGRLVSTDVLPGQPRPSNEEIAEAVGLIESDPQIGRAMQRLQPFYEGGFVLSEDKGFACGPGTRCLQIRVAARGDHMGTVRWVAVDLVGQKLAYRNLGAVERDRLTRLHEGGQQ